MTFLMLWQVQKWANKLDLRVRALGWSTLLWLHLLFLVRLCGWEIERIDDWREVVLTGIPEEI